MKKDTPGRDVGHKWFIVAHWLGCGRTKCHEYCVSRSYCDVSGGDRACKCFHAHPGVTARRTLRLEQSGLLFSIARAAKEHLYLCLARRTVRIANTCEIVPKRSV